MSVYSGVSEVQRTLGCCKGDSYSAGASVPALFETEWTGSLSQEKGQPFIKVGTVFMSVVEHGYNNSILLCILRVLIHSQKAFNLFLRPVVTRSFVFLFWLLFKVFQQRLGPWNDNHAEGNFSLLWP